MNNDELRRLAQAATPGPWVIDEGATIYSDDGDQTLFDPVCADPEECEQCQADAAYIAALHPGTTLALLDALSAAGQERDRWKALADRRGRQLDKMCGQGRTDSAEGDVLSAAEQENERLKRQRNLNLDDFYESYHRCEIERDEARAVIAAYEKWGSSCFEDDGIVRATPSEKGMRQFRALTTDSAEGDEWPDCGVEQCRRHSRQLNHEYCYRCRLIMRQFRALTTASAEGEDVATAWEIGYLASDGAVRSRIIRAPDGWKITASTAMILFEGDDCPGTIIGHAKCAEPTSEGGER